MGFIQDIATERFSDSVVTQHPSVIWSSVSSRHWGNYSYKYTALARAHISDTPHRNRHSVVTGEHSVCKTSSTPATMSKQQATTLPVASTMLLRHCCWCGTGFSL